MEGIYGGYIWRVGRIYVCVCVCVYLAPLRSYQDDRVLLGGEGALYICVCRCVC
jgi:hypothetical protein